MTATEKGKLFEKKRRQVAKEVEQELKSRDLWHATDKHIIEAYSEELAFAEMLKKEIMGLDETNENSHRLMQTSRRRNAHLNTAKQYATQLKVGPYGRKRFHDAKEEKKKQEKGKITNLIPVRQKAK